MVITYNDKIIVSKEMKQVRKYDLKKKERKLLTFFHYRKLQHAYINVDRIGQNLIKLKS